MKSLSRDNVENQLAPSLAIVIPTFNSAATLAACLDSIRSQDVSADEVVVVDDVRTTDNTRMIAGARNATVIVSPAGMAESRNVGVFNTHSRLILSLDSDMTLESGLFRKVLAEFRRTGFDCASIAERSMGSGYWSRARVIDKLSVEASGYGRSIRVFTRDLFLVIAGYDPGLEAGEDADFHRRAVRQTPKVVHIAAPAILHHEGRLTLGAVARKKYRYGTTLAAFEAKHGRGAILGGYRQRIMIGLRIALETDPLATPGFLMMKATDAAAGVAGRLLPHQRAQAGQAQGNSGRK